MPLRIALDLDDVLVDFDHSFAYLLEEHHQIEIPKPETFPDQYNWYDALVTPEQLATTWGWIDQNPVWWTTLPPTTGAIEASVDGSLPQLCYEHEIFLLTCRPQSAKGASESWFGDLTGLYAGVITTQAKGPLVAALHCDVMFDDNLQHLEQAADVVPSTTSLFLVTANHNVAAEPAARIRRVSLAEGIRAILP